MTDDYRIALRPYTAHGGKGSGPTELPLDDIVVKDVCMFRMEDMGDYFWMCCYLGDKPDGERICFSVRPGRRKKGEPRIVIEAYELPDVAYEDRGKAPTVPVEPRSAPNGTHGADETTDAGSRRRATLPKDWARRRAAVLERDRWCCCPTCARCYYTGDLRPCDRRSTDCDHVGDANDHSLGNLRGLCGPCHDWRSAQQGGRARANAR